MSRPSLPQRWATGATYSSGPYPGQTNKATPSSGMVIEGFDPQNFLAAEHINSLFNNHGDWLDSMFASWFGTGADGAYGPGFGNQAVSSRQYTDLTMGNGDVLDLSSGGILFVSGTFSASGTATLRCRGV